MTDIIWLEDNKKLMDKYEEAFNANGFHIFKCTTSSQALQLLLADRSPYLLLDINFPGGVRDGIIFLEQLHILKLRVVAVILTGYPELEETVRLTKQGMIADYLTKPLSWGKADQFVFFVKLKEAFCTATFARMNDSGLLRKWRWKTWTLVIAVTAAVIISWLLVSARHRWDLGWFFNWMKKDTIASGVTAFLWLLFESLLLKSVYDKYWNHSNIKSYLERKRNNRPPG